MQDKQAYGELAERSLEYFREGLAAIAEREAKTPPRMTRSGEDRFLALLLPPYEGLGGDPTWLMGEVSADILAASGEPLAAELQQYLEGHKKQLLEGRGHGHRMVIAAGLAEVIEENQGRRQ